MNKQQTAVELLKQDIDLEIKSGTKMVVNWDMYLEMEKQQIIDAANLPKEDRWYDAKKYSNCGEQYYNEQFKKD